LWKGGTPGDPYWSNVVLLMGFEGANLSQGAPGMTDESSHAHGTATVTTAAITTGVFKFGASSCGFTTAPVSTVQFANSADWNFGSGNFTIEGWIYPVTDGGTGTIISLWQPTNQLSWLVFVAMGGDHHLHWDTSTTGSGVNADIIGATTLVASTWYHFAIDFDGIKYRMYINGVMDGSFSTPRTLFSSTAALTMGTSNGGGNAYDGDLDEIRVTKGVARYASDSGFAVPTAAFPRHA
jgi:hypothetical protein